MKGILVILLVFGLVLLAAVAFALVPNLLTPAAPTLPPPNGAATPTLAAAQQATLPPAPAPAEATAQPGATLPAVGGGGGTAAFNGRFAGTLASDDGSTAPVSLDLTQTGSTVAGDIAIGDGLSIDGGNCGAQAIPAGARSVSGQVDPSNPNHIEVAAGYEVQGFNITAALSADLSPDGNSLNGRINLSLPFLCGRNPVITGSLTRQ
jgi:cytoskeletal protein RodZ